MSVSSRLRAFLGCTTPAVWVLALLSLGSAAIVFTRPEARREGLVLWLFARSHVKAYEPPIERWNAEQPSPLTRLDALLIDGPAMERRLLSGFTAGTPLPDLVEVERAVAAKTFTGPLEDIGFHDLTGRLREEGLWESLNAPSFAPWTSRGRVFGIPHDVHPMLLAYRSDLVEAAGVDLSGVETWDEFFAAMRPLMADRDGDGRPDRYLLNFWPTQSAQMESLLLQGGGGFFDERDRVAIATERNAELLARMALWCAGPGRVVVDAPEFSAAGNALRLQGVVVATLMPDWLAGIWKLDLPGLAGKVRLMPLPAWEKGGRRTSVMGGTMLGIPKTTENFEVAWALAKRLYLDREVHARFFAQTTIIPPVKTSWDHPAFHAPDAYFGGQPSGTLFIAQAGEVPARTSSPYNNLALARVNEVLLALAERVDREQIVEPGALLPEARSRLAEAHERVRAQIERNVFLRPEAAR